MENKLFAIFDKDGDEMPLKNGKYRTEQEADSLLERLNYNGEYRPYYKKCINEATN